MNAAAVDHVFSVMGATYGAAWDRSLGTAPISDVKTVWSDALADFCHSDNAKRSIIWGLKNLTDTVPNSRQFRTLCRQAPTPVVELRLEMPKADPERMRAELAKIAVIPVSSVDHKAWAKKILLDVRAGFKRNSTSVLFAKQALGEL